jgi:MFS family permease
VPDAAQPLLKSTVPARSPALGLAVVGLGASIGPLDFSVTVAFPAIAAAFDLQISDIRWVAVWYVLSYGSLMLAFGALGDRIGHLRVFRFGLVLSAFAYGLCALAPSYHWLLATRVLQGIAVALTISCGPALAIAVFAEHQRTRALSGYAAMASLAGIVAPLIGGASVALLGWPGVYWFRLPIVLLALLCLPLLGPEIGRVQGRPAPFDLAGSALLSAAVALMLLLPALLRPDKAGLLAVPVALGSAFLMTLFVRRQGRSASPFLPHSVVRDGDFILANLSSTVVQFTCFAIPLTVPYYLTRIAGWGPVATGGLLAIWALGSMAGSAYASRAVRRRGARPTVLHAGLLVIAGLAAISVWSNTPHYPFMVACLLVQGVGIGLFQVAYTDLVVAALPTSARGVAGSLTMVTRTVGIVIGASAWMWMMQALETKGLGGGSAAHEAFIAAFETVFRTAAVVAGLFFVLSLRRWRA